MWRPVAEDRINHSNVSNQRAEKLLNYLGYPDNHNMVIYTPYKFHENPSITY